MEKEKAVKQLKRKKFFEVDVPILQTKIQLIGNSIQDLNKRTIKLDLTRQLKGKGVEAIFTIKTQDQTATAIPKKICLMSYFIRRMFRKRISYIENSFSAFTKESLAIVKPFLITRNKVSRAVRKTLRNTCKNWLEDYLRTKTNQEIFEEIFSNKIQRSLSIILKRIYPLSLCEIRTFEIKRPLTEIEIEESQKAKSIIRPKEIEKIIEKEKQTKIKRAEKEIKETQKKAAELEEIQEKEIEKKEEPETKEKKRAAKKTTKETKKNTKKEE